MDSALVKEMNQLQRWFSPNTESLEKSLFSANWRLGYYLKRYEHEVQKRKLAGFTWPEIVDDTCVSMLFNDIESARESVRELELSVHRGKRLAYLISVYSLYNGKRMAEQPVVKNCTGVQLNLSL